jgi:hypothetical protein
MGEAPGALDHSPMPLLVEAPTPVRRFGGPGDRVAVLDDGTVVGWPGPTLGASPPEPLAGLDDVVVALGLPTMGLALRADGSVTAWGASFCGQLGNGTTDHADRPVAVTGIGAVVDIAAMGGSRFALGADGSVWAWGAGDGGRLGLGTSENALAPVAVPGLARGVQAIAPGIALKEDGSVWSWGGERLPEGLGADASLQLGATKLGGRPDVPVGFRWPAGDNQPMSFLAQVNLADVAPFDRDRLLPPSGLLSFFYRWPDDPFAEPAHAVFVTEAGVPLLRADYPAELPAKRRERAVVLVPEADFTLHPWGPASLTHDERGAYRYGVLPQPEEVVHRMLGHPGLVQDAAAPPERVLLLQIDLYDPGSFPDGAGRLHFLIAEDDLAQGRFERVESNYECD